MSKFCSDCGTALAAYAGYCGACGAAVSQARQNDGGAGGQQSGFGQNNGYAPPPQPFRQGYAPSSTYSRNPDRQISGLGWMVEPLRRYGDFNGRSRRTEYWMYTLLHVIILLPLGLVILAGLPWAEMDYNPQAEPEPLFFFGIGLLILWWLGTIVPSIAVSVRRFHDQDKSGWLYLLALVPYVGGLILFVFMLMEGTRGPNQYGDDPKGTTFGDVFS